MWRISKDGDKYCVHKEAPDGTLGEAVAGGCHARRADATAHMRALYANVPDAGKSPETSLWLNTYADTFDQTDSDSMAEMAANGAVRKGRMVGVYKSADGKIIHEGWGMLFTDADHPDLENTYFTAKTQTLLDYYKGAPLWYEHGQDPAYGSMPIGKRLDAKVYPRGVYLTHELHPDHPQVDRTVAESKAGMHTYSTDSIGHHVQPNMSADGSYGMWPMAGCSITRRPAEPALGASVVSIKAFCSALEAADAEARESQSKSSGASSTDNEPNVSIENPKRMQAMKLLPVLARAFNVPEEIEAVKSAIAAYAATFDGLEDDAEAAPEVVASLALEDGATVSAAKSVLDSFMSELDEPVITIDAEQIAAAKSSIKEAAKSYKPARTVAATVTTDAKKTHYTTVNLQRAEKPTLTGLIMGVVGDKSVSAMKAAGYNIGENGRWLINTQESPEILPKFYAKTVVLESGAKKVPMQGIETLTERKFKSGGTAVWRGEGQTVSSTDPLWGFYTLNLKELVATHTINRRLLRSGAANLESELLNDLANAMALKADLSALTGTGAKTSGNSGAEPLGLVNISGVTSTSLGTNGRVLSPKDMVDGYGRIEDALIPMSDTWGAIAAPRTARTMKNTTDTTGQLIPMERFTQGYGVNTTTQIGITDTVGTSSDCTKVFLGAWEWLFWGDGQEVTYTIDKSIYVREGLIYLEAALMCDIATPFPEAFQVLTGVRA